MLERDLASVVYFLICVKWYQSFDYFPVMTEDDRLQSLSIRMGTVERKIDVVKSTLGNVIQELKILSLKFDDQSLTDDTYRSGRDHSSILHLHINHHHITHELIFLHHLHPRIHHSNHHHIVHQLIFLNHHHIVHQLIFLNHYYYTPLQPSMRVQLMLIRDCSATKRLPKLRSGIKFFIQGVRSRVRYATLSLTTKAARTWCLEHL